MLEGLSQLVVAQFIPGISRVNTGGVVKQIRLISYSPPGPDVEGSDELDGEEVEVVRNSAGKKSSNSPSHPPSKIFQSQLMPCTPRAFQTILSIIPTTLLPAPPNSSTTKPSLVPVGRPSPICQSRNSPIVTSQQLQPVASSSRRREELSIFLFPAAKVFQKRDCRTILVTREDPNTESENLDAMAGLSIRVDRNSREVIEYVNDMTIPGTSSEEKAAEFVMYEDELINYFQRTFDHLGRDSYLPCHCLCLV
ncbi:hypothetical protein O181_083683 [Austropuccinia psidii MF-1]|uniref:Uncharacterized protein n=1 Tax=Austropuccinia psidii MF-1 TaxID=1389203 RepID=A0A9Q3IJT3_9BASI|nr:hypothetical protein [Austropuccinia psidii MF-1]